MNLFILNKYYLVVFFLSFCNYIYSQWHGELEKIKSTSSSIQLYDKNKTGSTLIYLPITQQDQEEWSFLVHMKYNPSSKNYLTFYPYLYSTDESHALQVILGKESKNTDVISISYKRNKQSTPIWQSPTDLILKDDSLNVRIKLIHKHDLWTIYVGDDFSEQFKFTSPTQSKLFTGFKFRYTSTRNTAFYIHNFEHQASTKPQITDSYFFHKDSFMLVLTSEILQLDVLSASIRPKIIPPNRVVLSKNNWAYDQTEPIDLLVNSYPLHFLPNTHVYDSIYILNISNYPGEMTFHFDQDIEPSILHLNYLIHKGHITSFSHQNQKLIFQIPEKLMGTLVTFKIDSLVYNPTSPNFDTQFFRHKDTTLWLAYRARKGDLKINEIMHNPKGNEPEAIELKNTSKKTIDLNHIYIKDYYSSGKKFTSRVVTPNSILIRPHEIVTLAKKEHIYPRTTVSRAIGSLTNSKDQIVVLNSFGETLDSVYYSNVWHHPDILPKSKGVSLQWNMKKNLWQSSSLQQQHTLGTMNRNFHIPIYSGKTPKYELIDSNAVAILWTSEDFELSPFKPHSMIKKTDTLIITLADKIAADESLILPIEVLYDSKPIDTVNLWLELPDFQAPQLRSLNLFQDSIVLNYHSPFLLIDQALTEIQKQNNSLPISHIDSRGKTFIIYYASNSYSKQLFPIQIHGVLHSKTQHRFPPKFSNSIDTTLIIKHIPSTHDILFNEILFDPDDTQEETIEIINISDFWINTQDIYFVDYDKHRQILSRKPLTNTPNWMAPKSIAAFSKYPLFVENNAYKSPAIPKLNNLSDLLVLANEDDMVLDSLEYHVSWHHTHLKNTSKGISLERINLSQSTSYKHNWTSSNSFFKHSLGKPNYSASKNTSHSIFSISSNILAPMRGGENNHLTITLTLDQADIINLYILDLQGHILHTLLDEKLIQGNTSILWYGTDQKDQILDPGFYIIYCQWKKSSKVERKLVTLSY